LHYEHVQDNKTGRNVGETPTVPKRILIVDDEPDITFTLEKGLEQGGYDVQVFNDPLVALSSFKSDIYGLLILDIKMPNMTGFELYRKLKR
jgi:DNA-binding response OmpR family regulator